MSLVNHFASLPFLVIISHGKEYAAYSCNTFACLCAVFVCLKLADIGLISYCVIILVVHLVLKVLTFEDLMRK